MKKFWSSRIYSAFLLASAICYLTPVICFSAVSEGQKAPAFAVFTLDDKTVSLRELLGPEANRNIVILNFFDTKCVPCVEEAPQFEKIWRKYKNVIVRMISIDPEKELVPPWIKKHNIKVPVLIDQFGVGAGKIYGIIQHKKAIVPQTFVIDKNGVLRKIIKGAEPNIGQLLEKQISLLTKEKVIPTTHKLLVIYTNSANGHFVSCDCPSNPYGGLVRRATYLKQLRKKYPNLLAFDTGDNFPPRSDELLADYILKTFELMRYTAVGLGDQEFINGSPWLEKAIERYDIPFLSANLQVCSETLCTLLAPADKIIKTPEGDRIAILSITHPDVFLFFPKDKIRNKTRYLKILPADEILGQYIPILKKKTDIIILLSHSGSDWDKKFARKFPDIDLIIGGHSQTLLKEPEKVGKTLIVQAGEKGQYVGKLLFTIRNKDRKIINYKSELVPLTPKFPDDLQVKKWLAEYGKKLEARSKKLLLEK